MKINSYKSNFKTYDTGKKIRIKYIPVIHALESVEGFQNYTMKPYNNSPANISLKEKIDRLPSLIKWIIDSTIRDTLTTEYYTKENIIRTKEIILKSIDNLLKSPVKASSQFNPSSSTNGQEALMNLVGIQHGTYSNRDSTYFAGGYYFLAKFTSNSPYILSPIFSLMVKSEYVTYLRYCQLFNLEIDNDIFEFWVDEKFDTQTTQYPTLRTAYRKSVLPVLKTNNIPIVKKKDMFYKMYQCFKLPDFSTIEDMDSWKASKVDTFMSKFKKEIAGETVIFSEEDKSEYTIYLHECGPSKLRCVKFIKDFTTLGLRECKEIADNANGFEGIFLVTKTQDEVEAFIQQLNEIGATASYRSGNQLQTPEYPTTPEEAYSGYSVGDYVIVLCDDEEDVISEGTLCTISEIDLGEGLQYGLDYEGSTYWYSRDQIRKATLLEIDPDDLAELASIQSELTPVERSVVQQIEQSNSLHSLSTSSLIVFSSMDGVLQHVPYIPDLHTSESVGVEDNQPF